MAVLKVGIINYSYNFRIFGNISKVINRCLAYCILKHGLILENDELYSNSAENTLALYAHGQWLIGTAETEKK